jgi:hypothetical protein
MTDPYPTETDQPYAPAPRANEATNHGAADEALDLLLLAEKPSNGDPMALEINGQALRRFAALQRRLHEDAASSANSWAGFFHRRMRDNIDMAERLASCRSLEDIYHVNIDHLQRATDEYLAQVERTVMAGRGLTLTAFTSVSGYRDDHPRE